MLRQMPPLCQPGQRRQDLQVRPQIAGGGDLPQAAKQAQISRVGGGLGRPAAAVVVAQGQANDGPPASIAL